MVTEVISLPIFVQTSQVPVLIEKYKSAEYSG
jgi:hypothetical protein